MRYVHTSYSDVDRTLEAFRWARRALLVLMAMTVPFAAWDTVSAPDTAVAEEAAPVHTAKQAQPLEQAAIVIVQDEACGPLAIAKRILHVAS